MARVLSHKLEIAWNGYTWIDESARLVNAAGRTRAGVGGGLATGKGVVDDMTITLDNVDGRFSPLNTSSPIFDDIRDNGAYQRPVRFSIDIGDGLTTVFVGTMKIPKETTATPKHPRTVRIDCRGSEDRVLTSKLSTPLNDFVYNHQQNLNESDLIAYALYKAGLNDGVDFVSQTYADANGVQATLDPGIFVIPWYWMDDESPIEDCWALADACGGRFYAGADGRFYYRNAYAPIFATDISATYGRGDFQDFAPVYDDRELYSAVSVETSPREVASNDVIWEPDAPISVPATETITVTAKMRRPIYAVSEVQFHAVSAGGRSLASDIVITSAQYAQRIVFSITNNNATYDAYLNRFAVLGVPIVGSISHDALASSDDAYWTNRPVRTRTIRGNPYIQSTAQAEFLARMNVDILDKPRLTYTLTKTPGRPGLQIGQRIQISDEKTGVIDHEAFVTGIQWTYGVKGYFQTISATNASGYLPYMDTPGYFILDTNRLDYDIERMFY